MSPDPYDGSYDLNNPQSLNRYAYTLNNPLAYIDPDGTTDCPASSPDGNTYCTVNGGDGWGVNGGAVMNYGNGYGNQGGIGSGGGGSTPNKKACAGLTPPSGPINYAQSAANNTKIGPFGWYQAFRNGGTQDFKGNAAFGSPANQVAAGNWNFGASVAAKGWSLSTAMALAGAGAFLSNVNSQAGYALSQTSYMQGQYGGLPAPNGSAPGPQWNMGPGFPGFPSNSGNQGDQVAPNENQAVISGYVWYAMGCHS